MTSGFAAIAWLSACCSADGPFEMSNVISSNFQPRAAIAGFMAPGAHAGMVQFTWIAYVDVFGALGSWLTVSGGFAANCLTSACARAMPPLADDPDPELLPLASLL